MLKDDAKAEAIARLTEFKFTHASKRPLEWLFSCDESGTGGARFYGFGAFIMDHNRRGDFQHEVRWLREKHSYEDEAKWHKVKYARFPFYRDLADLYFDTSRLAFHCIVISRAVIDRSLHGGDWDLARRKHFCMFLSDKICRQVRCRTDVEQVFRMWVDPIASREKKADEILHIVSNRLVARKVGPTAAGQDRIKGVYVHNSKDTPQIQVCDVLLGAVMDAWQEAATERGKMALKSHIARRLGWPDLKADTYPSARRFNIWYFKPGPQRREIATRSTPWDRKK